MSFTLSLLPDFTNRQQKWVFTTVYEHESVRHDSVSFSIHRVGYKTHRLFAFVKAGQASSVLWPACLLFVGITPSCVFFFSEHRRQLQRQPNIECFQLKIQKYHNGEGLRRKNASLLM